MSLASRQRAKVPSSLERLARSWSSTVCVCLAWVYAVHSAYMADVTKILNAIEHGDPHAAEQLLPLIYDELRKLAARRWCRRSPARPFRRRPWCTRPTCVWWTWGGLRTGTAADIFSRQRRKRCGGFWWSNRAASRRTSPAAASTVNVGGFPSPITAGAAGNFTVTLKDPYGNTASSYTGTVHFTSSDGKAALPANYTFTSIDAGAHTFSATLKTAGTQSITAADTTSFSLTGADRSIAVNAAAASKFILTAPASVNAGASFSITLTVEDAYGNVVTGYTGAVHFNSTDTKSKLPSNYTFKASDKGMHTFTGLVPRTKGNQKITITDTHNSLLTVSVVVDVL